MQTPDFEWQTGEQQDWDELRHLDEGDEKDSPQRPWRWLLLILVIFGLLAAGVYWLLDRRADRSTQVIKDELAATHQLLIEAEQSQDYELFSSLISDQEQYWFNTQAQLWSLNLFWERTVLGLEPINEDLAGDANLQIVTEPNLQRATISQTRSFTTRSDSRPFMLERVFLYKQSDDGWRLIRLDGSEFWGGWESQTGKILSLVYPQRDAETGRRLFPFLDELVNDYCARSAVNCPKNFELELKLDRREESLLRISEGYFSARILVRDGKGTVTLPAPTLVGRPLDDPGYEALAQGYAAWLGAVLVNNFAVINQVVDPAIVSELLASRGLEPPPLPNANMPWPVTAALPAGEAKPPHDILMLCRGGSQQRLLRLQTAEGEWMSEWQFRTNPSTNGNSLFPQPQLVRLPDYSGALVSFNAGEIDQGPYHTYLWRNGQEQFWLEHDRAPLYWSERFLRTGEQPYQTMNGYYLFIEDNRTVIEPWYLDVKACSEGDCERITADGVPLWSPDGRYTLLTLREPYEKPQISLGDEQGRIVSHLGSGLPVAWLDDETFAYLRGQIFGHTDPSQRGIWRELVQGNLTGDEQIIIDLRRLQSGIATERRSFQLGIVTAEPYQDGWLIATRELGNERQAGSYLFYYQPQTDELSIITENEMEMILPPLMLNIGGPYLAFAALRDGDFLLRFLDLENEQEVFRTGRFPDDWSADREWLLFSEGYQLRVVSPIHDFEWTIPHNLQGCYSAVWIER